MPYAEPAFFFLYLISFQHQAQAKVADRSEAAIAPHRTPQRKQAGKCVGSTASEFHVTFALSRAVSRRGVETGDWQRRRFELKHSR